MGDRDLDRERDLDLERDLDREREPSRLTGEELELELLFFLAAFVVEDFSFTGDLDRDLELLDLDGDGLWDREDCAVPPVTGDWVRLGLKSAVDIRSFLLAPGNNSAFLEAILALALASFRARLNSACNWLILAFNSVTLSIWDFSIFFIFSLINFSSLKSLALMAVISPALANNSLFLEVMVRF